MDATLVNVAADVKDLTLGPKKRTTELTEADNRFCTAYGRFQIICSKNIP